MIQSTSKAKILVVDDQPVNVKILAEALQADYDVRIANNGERALEIAQKYDKPDLILLDVMMPGLDGFEVCRLLKSDPTTSQIPVIFITAKNNADDEEKGLKIGAIDYISKPFSIPVVRARVSNHLLLKQRSELLKKSEERFRTTFEAAPIGVTNITLDGHLLAANQGYCDFLGYTADELLGMNLRQVTAPEFHQQYLEMIKKVLAGEISDFNHEKQYLRKDGQRVWGHLWVKLVFDIHGLPDHLIGVVENIDRRKQVEASNTVLLQAVEQSPASIIITNLDANIEYVNEAFVQNSGYSREEVIGQNPRFMQSGKTPKETYDALWASLTSGEVWKGELIDKRKDNVEYIESAVIAPVRQPDGTVSHYLGIKEDITDRKASEKKLLLAASVFSHAREGIMITEPNGRIIDVNQAFSLITGYQRREVLGRNPRLLKSGRQDSVFYSSLWQSLREKGHWYGEIWNRRKSGEVYAQMLTISAVYGGEGQISHFVSLFSDITTTKEHQKQLEHIAHYDALTNLPNRILLADRLHQGMVQTQRQMKPLAVVYLDLDGFKAINDSYGHEVGDQVLIAVATRMKKVLREVDTLARLGGDEFVAVLLNLDDIESSVPMLTRLLSAAAEQLVIGDLVLQVSASLGVSFYPQSEEVDADQLLRQADQSMYQAKLAGKNRYHIFDPEHDNNIRGYHETLDHIRRALEMDEFLLYYQPKVNMSSGQVIGAEALIRWLHTEKGLLPPSVFLPVIEDHALSIDLGEWVIRTALKQIMLWRTIGLDLPISVNVGARHLQQPDFVERLRKILAEYPEVNPNYLEIEILETSALEDIARISQIIEACHAFGVRFALDDFGTGYSSLTYLKRLPVQALKIDQSFVREMLDNPDDLVILDGVIGLSNAFNRTVIAEGVETVEHGVILLQLGCVCAQGFGIARPMPAQDMPDWSTTWRINSAWVKALPVTRDDLPVIFSSIAHREWINTVKNYIQGQSKICPPKLHHPCRLGIWLSTHGINRYGNHPSFESIEKLHNQVHELAESLLEGRADGRQTEESALLDGLIELHDALLEKLKLLLV